MKKALLILITLIVGFAQADAQLFKKKVIDQKYLAGAVTEENGHVVFSRTISLPEGYDADQAYQKSMNWIGAYYQNDNVLTRKNNNSNISEHLASAGIVEYLTFKKSALVLDRTQIIYMLDIATDGRQLNIKMYNITYFYDEEREKIHYAAENIITDSKAINKKGNGFIVENGKFRMKTIDKFEDICTSLSDYFK